MHTTVKLVKDSVATAGRGPFTLGHKGNFEFQKKDLIDKNIHLLKGKKVIFIPGGAGRLTNYARSLGVDGYCLDASFVCKAVCEKNYPDVPFLLKDMSYEMEGFDYAVFEDVQWHLPLCDSLLAVVNWQKVTKIIPDTVTYKIIHFNSTYMDETFGWVEPEGEIYYKKQLKLGIVTHYCNLEDLDNYQIEEFSIDLNGHIGKFEHLPNPNFKYMGVLDDHDPSSKTKIIRVHTEGLGYDYNTNSRHVVPLGIPEKIKTGFK